MAFFSDVFFIFANATKQKIISSNTKIAYMDITNSCSQPQAVKDNSIVVANTNDNIFFHFKFSSIKAFLQNGVPFCKEKVKSKLVCKIPLGINRACHLL